MSKKLLLTICLLATSISMASAQPSWQWGKRGGSSDASGAGADETVMDMATDQHGNIYVLSSILQTGANVDGHAVGEWGNYDVSISSFKCDGTFRWSKTIGGSGNDYGMALRTDTLGGVYVTGFLSTHFITIHIDADSAWGTGTYYQSFYIAKFDTGGNYKWFRMPQADTVGATAYSNTAPFDMDVDGAGNVYVLCQLAPGIYSNSYVASGGVGVHMLKYDKYGNFISGNPMQIAITGISPKFKMKRDHQSGRYYVTGTLLFTGGTLSFGGTPITHPMYVGCFNSAGTLIWQRQDTDPPTFFSTFGRASIDLQHNIYLGGKASYTDTFNSYVVVNGGSSATPVIFKLDTNGNNIWAKNATVNAVTFCNNVILSGNEVAIAGQYPAKLVWAGFSDSLSLPSGSGYHNFITTFDTATGNVLKVDSLRSTAGYNNHTTSLAADRLGNFYVGGDFGGDLTVSGTTLNSAGGGSDFFIAKYGNSNCNAGTLEAPPGLPRGEEVLRVYPNPASDELVIENAVIGSNVKLLNMMSQVLYSWIVSNNHFVVSIRSFKSGMYILHVIDDAGNRTTKTIVKQ